MILIPFLYVQWLYCAHYVSLIPQEGGTRGQKMGEDFAFENQVCIILRYSMILIPFLFIVAVLPHYVSLVP